MFDDSQEPKLKPFGEINSEGFVVPLVETKPVPEKLVQEVANSINILTDIENGSVATHGRILSHEEVQDLLNYKRKLVRGDLILEATRSDNSILYYDGSAYEILSSLARNKDSFAKLTNVILRNHTGDELLRSYSKSNESIIEFLIYESTGRMLGSVNSKTYVFECTFDYGVVYYDLYYVLHRPNNSEFNGMKRISLYNKTNETVLSELFDHYGKLDITEKLKGWTKRVYGYEGWGQADADKEIVEIREMFTAVHDLLKPTPTDVDRFKETESTGDAQDNTDEIREFAVNEQLKTLRTIIETSDTELSLKHLAVLEFILKK